MHKLKKILGYFFAIALHLVAIAALWYFFQPVVSWYLKKEILRGTDFFNSGTYVSYLTKHFSWPFFGWKYIWYQGNPYGSDYPFLHFYFMVPFVNYFGLTSGIRFFALAATAVGAIFSYFCFFELSRNRAFSVLLTVLTIFSINYYRALVWAGGIPYYTTQAYLPVVVYLLIRYLKSQKRKWLMFTALGIGVGMLAHPQPFVSFVAPIAAILILTWVGEHEGFFRLKKIKDLFLLGGVSAIIALPTIFNLLKTSFDILFVYIQGLVGLRALGEGASGPGSLARSMGSYGAGSVLDEASAKIIEWAHDQFYLVFKDTNTGLWVLLGVSVGMFVIGFPFGKKRLRSLFGSLPFLLVLGWIIFYAYLLSIGINLYHGGWYKVFWPVPFGVGLLASYFWGGTHKFFINWPLFNKISWSGAVFAVPLSLLALFLGLLLYPDSINGFFDRLEQSSLVSSAYPGALNVVNGDTEKLKTDILPSFISPTQKDYRLYMIDATVNIWWNAYFDLPLARGYIDPPHGGEAGALFWLNTALSPSPNGPSSSLVEDWKTPEPIAINNTKFLLDWFSIKYLEGNHQSQTSSQLAKYATSPEFIQKEEPKLIPGFLKLYVYDWGGEEWHSDGTTPLNYYEIKDELTSPILSATNVPVIAVIGNESAVDTLYRALALLNLNSQKLIFARGPARVDEWSLNQLASFDGVVLYNYDYKNHQKTWDLIGKYIEHGGRVFVETGGDVKQSDSVNLPVNFPKELPEFFPIKRTKRADLGQAWDAHFGADPKWQTVNAQAFAPLEEDGKPWNVSFPPGPEDLRVGAEIILKKGDTPVVAKMTSGAGHLIWSGLNLPYHAIRGQNQTEAQFLVNLITESMDMSAVPVKSANARFVSSERREIDADKSKGVLFKEQFFPGWKAHLKTANTNQTLPIYSVGPTVPGFMYVKIPQDQAGTVTFNYTGDPTGKPYVILSLITVCAILDYLIGGKTLIALFHYGIKFSKKQTRHWWNKDEEY